MRGLACKNTKKHAQPVNPKHNIWQTGLEGISLKLQMAKRRLSISLVPLQYSCRRRGMLETLGNPNSG